MVTKENEELEEIQIEEVEEEFSQSFPTCIMHNQIQNYQSIHSGLSQFIIENKSSLSQSNNLQSRFDAAIRYQEIVTQRGSRCKCKKLGAGGQELQTRAKQLLSTQANNSIGIQSQSETKQLQNSKIRINESITLTSKNMGIEVKEGKCGPYCKNLNSEEQRSIIKNILKN